MARIKYERSAQAGGFRPIQVSDKNLARQQEAANRTLDGMRLAAEMDIKNRQNYLQQIKEDDAAEAAMMEKNFQINLQNSKNDLRGIEAGEAQAERQFQIKQQETSKLFQNLSSLSTTAAQYVGEEMQRQRVAQFTADSTNVDQIEQLRQVIKRYNLARASEAQNAAVDQANVSEDFKLREYLKNAGLNFEVRAGHLYGLSQTVIPQQMERALQDWSEKNNAIPTGEQAAVITGKVVQQYYEMFAVNNIRPEFMKMIAPQVASAQNAIINRQQRQTVAISLDQLKDQSSRAITTGNPVDLQLTISSAYPSLIRAFGGSVTDAKKHLMSLLNGKDADGNFKHSIDDLKRVVLFAQGGKPVGFSESEIDEISRKRFLIDKQEREQAKYIQKAAFEDAEAQAIEELSNKPGGWTEEDVNEKLTALSQAHPGFVSTRLKEMDKWTVTDRQNNQTIADISGLPDYNKYDPEMYNAMARATGRSGEKWREYNAGYEAYNANWKSKTWKNAEKMTTRAVTGMLNFTGEQALEIPYNEINKYALKDLRSLTEKGMAAGLDFEAASGQALLEVEKRIQAGKAARADGSLPPSYEPYRMVNTPTGPTWPSLESMNEQNKAKLDRQRYQESEMRKKARKAGSFRAFLADPDSILTDLQFGEEMQNYGKPGYKPNPLLVYAKTLSNGMPLHEVLNGIAEAKQDPRRVQSELALSRGAERVFFDSSAGNNARGRALLESNGGIRSAPMRIQITQARDDTSRSTGTDFVIDGGRRGAEYAFPLQAEVLKVVRDQSEEFRLEEGDTRRGYGNLVELRVTMPNGTKTDFLISHFDKVSELDPGDMIEPGTIIGTQGRSGSTTGAHISIDAFEPGSMTPDPAAREWFLKNYLQK